MRNKLRRPLAFLLSAVMIVTMSGTPVHAVADRGQPETGLCEHHAAHTDECGYTEETPGTPCGHEHTEDCYIEVTECVHEHTPECYPEETEDSVSDNEATPANAEEREPENCPHICDGESGCITEKLDCRHEHDSECGYTESTPGTPCTYVCEICNPQDSGEADEEPETGIVKQEQCSCLTLCTEGQINPDCPVCGAENAGLSDCKGKAAEEDTEQPEDTGICKHHQEHDDACGYQPESEDSEGSPCTYECRICPIEDLIAALPGEVTEDNAENVRAQLDKILALFGELTEDEQEQLDLSRCYELQEALDGANAPNSITESVEYQEASWDGGKVTYERKTETCTLVENSTEAVTWTAGWYAVSGTVTISEPITVTGEVHLILVDGCTLNAEKGIVVTTGNSLTIYAQSGGTGTLMATGTVDGNNASAGIGGSTSSPNSGTITIHGGVINAIGGCVGNAQRVAAGIGGGTGDTGGSGSNITIYGGKVTAVSPKNNGGNGGAGIGGGGGAGIGGSGSTIAIRSGTVQATGGDMGAGIGGGYGGEGSGNGTNITISGGTVTAIGGDYAAGIGGGGGYQYSAEYIGSGSVTGGTGSVTISGGIVDASSPTDVYWKGYEGAPIGNGGNAGDTAATVSRDNAIVFENGAGTVCGDVTFNGSYEVPAGYTLNIPTGASLSGSGTLSGGGTFTTDLSEDMISVPEDWHYTGEDLTDQIKAAVILNGEVTICGQTFTADTDGWELSVEKVSELEYTVKYIHSEKGTLSKTVTIAKGQPSLSDATAYKADGTTPATTFGVGETIIIKATPAFPTNGAVMAAAFTEPAGEQMAVYYNDTQISAPSTVENSVHTMTVDTSNLPPEVLNKEIALTVKYIESGNASGAQTEVKVTVTAVAKVEKDGTATLVDKTAFLNAFKDSTNNGVTITMLNNVELTKDESITLEYSCTLDLNGHTISQPDITPSTFSIVSGTVTIKDSGTGGEIRSGNTAIGVSSGTVSIESGTVSGSYIGVQVTVGSVNISGTAVISGDNNVGLLVERSGSITISGGTFSGVAAVQISDDASVTLKDMLATGYAYHQNDIPVAKAEGLVGDYEVGEVPLDAKPAWLTGTVTVKECNHTGEGVCEYTPNEGVETHAMTCLACGYAGAAESCAYSDDYGHDETNHWQTCTLCGGKKTEAHGWVHQCTSATGIIRRSCDKCEIETVVGTVSITPDFSVTYGKTGSATLVCTAELADGYSLEPADSADNCWVLMALSDGKSWNLGRELEVKLPADLPAGEYWYNASPRLSYQGNNTIVKRFNVLGQVTVTPAPLTVTGAAAKDRTYDGTNSVQITGVTLDGILNGDDVSVDTTGLTGTLNGSDAETYTSVTLPRLTLTGGAASNYTLPQSMGAVPASVTISKAPLTVTGATIQTRPYKPTYHTAEVSGVTFTGLVNGETLALGQDYTAFGNYDDPNAGENKSATILVELGLV